MEEAISTRLFACPTQSSTLCSIGTNLLFFEKGEPTKRHGSGSTVPEGQKAYSGPVRSSAALE